MQQSRLRLLLSSSTQLNRYFINIFSRYFSLKNHSITTAIKGFFKQNYHEESQFRTAKRMGGYLVPKIYLFNQVELLIGFHFYKFRVHLKMSFKEFE